VCGGGRASPSDRAVPPEWRRGSPDGPRAARRSRPPRRAPATRPLERTIETVGRAAAGRQHDRVHTLDPPLHARSRRSRRSRPSPRTARSSVPGVRTTPGGEQPFIERRDRGHADVLAHVEERRHHFDPLALARGAARRSRAPVACCTSSTTTTFAPTLASPDSTSRSVTTCLPSLPGTGGTNGCDPVATITVIGALRQHSRPPSLRPRAARSIASFPTWAARKPHDARITRRVRAPEPRAIPDRPARPSFFEQHDAMAPGPPPMRAALQPGHAAADHHDLLGCFRGRGCRRARARGQWPDSGRTSQACPGRCDRYSPRSPPRHVRMSSSRPSRAFPGKVGIGDQPRRVIPTTSICPAATVRSAWTGSTMRLAWKIGTPRRGLLDGRRQRQEHSRRIAHVRHSRGLQLVGVSAAADDRQEVDQAPTWRDGRRSPPCRPR